MSTQVWALLMERIPVPYKNLSSGLPEMCSLPGLLKILLDLAWGLGGFKHKCRVLLDFWELEGTQRPGEK